MIASWLIGRIFRKRSNFIKINDMADEAGIRAILDEAEFQDGGHEKILAQWEDFPLNRRVFYTFLHRSELWDNACLFHHSDSLPQNWWKKRKGFGHLKAETAPEAIEALAKTISLSMTVRERTAEWKY